MSDAKGQVEPPMEEILASIRRIISEDEKAESALETQDLDAAQDLGADHLEEDSLELHAESMDPQSLELSDELDMADSALILNDPVETAETLSDDSEEVLPLSLEDALPLEETFLEEDDAVLELSEAVLSESSEDVSSELNTLSNTLSELDEEEDEMPLELTERIEEDGQIADAKSVPEVMAHFEEDDEGQDELQDELDVAETISDTAIDTSLSDAIEQNLVENIDVADVMSALSGKELSGKELSDQGGVDTQPDESLNDIDDNSDIELAEKITSSVFDTQAVAEESIVDAFVSEDTSQHDLMQEDKEMEQLVSDTTASTSAAAFAALAKAAQEKEVLSAPKQVMPDMALSNQSLESLVTEMLRPMLKEWLDKNLPAMVDTMIKKEIKRLTAGS